MDFQVQVECGRDGLEHRQGVAAIFGILQLGDYLLLGADRVGKLALGETGGMASGEDHLGDADVAGEALDVVVAGWVAPIRSQGRSSASFLRVRLAIGLRLRQRFLTPFPSRQWICR